MKRLLVLIGVTLLAGCATAQDGSTSSAESERIARDGYAAFARGDMEAVMGVMSADMVWYEAEGLPFGGVYLGPEAVMENVFANIGAEWDDYETEPTLVIASGERVAVWGRYRGVHKTSGKRLDVPFVHVWILEDGKLIEFRQLTDTALYNAAMGGETR